MAEELRFFLRTAIWIAVAVVVYWILSQEPAGTVLLLFLLAGLVAFIAVAAAFAPAALSELGGAGPVGFVNRLIGFHEPTDERPPLEAGPEIIPLGSSWPIVTAASFVIIGLGFIYGPWLLLPGIAVLAIGGIGWLT